MRRKPLVPLFAVAALAGALGWCGNASAATKPVPRPAGAEGETARGAVSISGYSANDGAKSAVVLTGAIGDFGEGVRTYANGTIEKQYNQLDLEVTRGSFRLNIAGLEQTLVDAFAHFPSNTTTCSGIVTATGSTPIVAGSGTGAYRGIGGNFTTTITVHEVDSWPRYGALLAETIVLTASGVVSFG
jgi:hypothetical protein